MDGGRGEAHVPGVDDARPQAAERLGNRRNGEVWLVMVGCPLCISPNRYGNGQQPPNNRTATSQPSTRPAPDPLPIDLGRAQHGKPPHDATGYNQARNWGNDPNTLPGTARYNQNLVNAEGDAVAGFVPDAQRIRVTSDGRRVVDVLEVQSPSQSDAFMDAKADAIRRALGDHAGDVRWEPPASGTIRQ